MKRLAPLISLEYLKSICRDKLGVGTDRFDPYRLPAQIQKDLAKINFDFENCELGNADASYEKYPSDHQGFNNYPCGYEVLSNSLPVLFVNAGGDWELPICFCIYWDGNKLRAYIPEDGNAFNKKERCAYGSEEDLDQYDSDFFTRDDKKGDPDRIRKDVMDRIVVT